MSARETVGCQFVNLSGLPAWRVLRRDSPSHRSIWRLLTLSTTAGAVSSWSWSKVEIINYFCKGQIR